MYFKTAVENVNWAHRAKEIPLGSACLFFERNGSRDTGGDTGHHMANQYRNPNPVKSKAHIVK